ncbi:hypothetical protein [Fuerstiella marisgermanici]|uniref:DUF4013 domain-containing protein n=1 Tax=Fuerstiella marisgermanici TaxID=1891926 RepID=A0A1P8WQ57_9PLAN|nr:hypothetical protein [Fuerstiella marisgermanici]APZ96191.1 hypothetical protein Fuma_05859 [Fuerstiella marisgermanici]
MRGTDDLNPEDLDMPLPTYPSAQPVASVSDDDTAADVETDFTAKLVSTAPDSLESQLGPGRFPGIRKPFRSLWWLVQVVLGLGFLLPLLAGLAAIPGVNLLSLGMLLDAEARVGKSGRFRDGIPLLAVSTRIGTIGLMVFIFLVPIMMTSSVAEGQQVVSQLSGGSLNGLSFVTRVLQVVIFCHLLLAIANGGSFACFLRPIRNLRRLIRDVRSGEYSSNVNLWTERLTNVLRPWHHLKLAVWGAIGALCWLAIPTLLLGALSTQPHEDLGPSAIVTILGAILIIPVAAWLPLLQCHQAVTGRFKAIFEVRKAREIICRVPIRWAVATILLYGLAIPLYLSKVVSWPVDALWLFTPLFIIVIYPTRILMGWVYGTGVQKNLRAPKLIRWPTKVVMVPLIAIYALTLFLLPTISEAGGRAMFENHAFLLPVPSGERN